MRSQTYNPEGTETRGKLSRQKSKVQGSESDRETPNGTQRDKKPERLKNRERAARHAGRLSVSGLWECGEDTVVAGRVPALKLESGAKGREPEPKAVWELPAAASPARCRNGIYCWTALRAARRYQCAISLGSSAPLGDFTAL